MDNKRKYHYVYLVFDNKNEMFYCGKRSTNTPILNDVYYGSGNIIRRITKSCNKANERLTKIILQICNSYEENIVAEKYWVNKVFNAPSNPLFYNIANGGYGGNLIAGFTNEQKKEVYKKIGLSNKGKKLTDETKRKISISGLGLKRSKKTRERISNAKKGQKNSFYGKKHNKESIEKISKSSKGSNNPRAVFIQVFDKENKILFEGIRKDVSEWCINNGICSESNMKNHLYSGKEFNPKYTVSAYPKCKQYAGIIFKYK